LQVLQVIVSGFNNNASLALMIKSSKLSVAACWVKRLHSSQWEWCRLKSFTINCLQSSLSSSLKQEMIDNSSVNKIDNEHEL